MRLDSTTLSFLRGDTLSNGHNFPVDRSAFVGRNELLTRLVRGKVVLHVGCADHVELIRAKRNADIYLHDLLTAAATRVVGIDVNKAALIEMTTIGISDLYHPSDLPYGLKFDLVVVPDVIEHIPDVAKFLGGLKQHECDVVFTTPNALGLSNRFRFHTESVNTDHRYWFSPYTLAKSVAEAGYEIREMWCTDTFARRQPLRSLVKLHFPLCRDGLAIRATPQR